MKSTHDIIYFIRPVYSKTKAGTYTSVTPAGPIVEGTEGLTGPGVSDYSSERVEDAVVDSGNHEDFAVTAVSYLPIRKSTVNVLHNGEVVATDDGSGNIAGTYDFGTGARTITGTVDYDGDAGDDIVIVLTAGETVDPNMTVEFRTDQESNPDNIGGVDIVFGTFPVVARPHKLELKWSVDAALTAAANVGIDVEDQLSIFAAQELKAQQDQSLVNTLKRAAGKIDDKLIFNADNTSDYYPNYMHAQDLRISLAEGDNRILETTGRGMVSWYVVGNNVEAYLRYLDGYKREPNPVPIGVYRIGTYDGKPVFKHAHLGKDEYLVGYKGSIFGDAGCVLAKYIEVYATPTIELSDFIGRKGLASFYDKKVIVPTYYKRGQVTNIPLPA